MARIDELSQNLDDMSGLVDRLVAFIVAADALHTADQTAIADLLAGDAAMAAQVQAVFDKSETVEAKMRASIPGVPPPGGTPLLQSYASAGEFDAAVAAYTGPEAVNKDGIEVKAGTAPALEYFSHSGDGSVSTTGPTD